MGRRAHKLPTASGVLPDIDIGDRDWKRIEGAYVRLSADARMRIGAATRVFLRNATLELNAESPKDAKEIVDEVAKATGCLRLALSERFNGLSGAAIHARRLVGQHFENVRVPKDADKLDFIDAVLASLWAACR